MNLSELKRFRKLNLSELKELYKQHLLLNYDQREYEDREEVRTHLIRHVSPLIEIAELAKELGLRMSPAFRKPGAEYPADRLLEAIKKFEES